MLTLRMYGDESRHEERAVTCTRYGNVIICTNPWGRLTLGNRYVWVDFHAYCGPSFFWDSAMTKLYDPTGENDPIWPVFDAWLSRHNAALEKAKTVKHRGRFRTVVTPKEPT